MRVLAHKVCPERQTIRMDRVITCEPLELEYLLSYLADHEVTLLDGMTDRKDPVTAARRLRSQVVLITAHITNAMSVKRIAARMKALPEPPHVFVGGPTAEVTPEVFFDPSVDGVFFANSLEGIRATLAHLERGTDWQATPGVAIQTAEGEFVRNPGPPLDPAKLLPPTRTQLATQPELYYYMFFDRCASVKTAFGCPQNCVFCFCAEQQAGRFAARPMTAVVDEIATLPVENVFILDDNFLTGRNRVLEFCKLITERAVKKRFIIYGNADFVARHPDVMTALRDAGVAGLITGFEFVTDDRLFSVGKRARVADNDRTVDTCRDLGIELFALFVVDPDWRSEDFRSLRRYIQSRKIIHATFSTYTTFPGTQLARQTGHLPPPDGTWWRYDLLRLHRRPRHLSPLRYYLWLFYLYLLPSMAFSTMRRLRQLYGTRRFVRLIAYSWLIGLEYLAKLIIWR